MACAGTTIALSCSNLQDWLPGVAGSEPRLGSGFLGGQFKKGGLHQPPFSFRPWTFVVVGRCGSLLPASVSSKWFSSEGLIRQALFLFPGLSFR